jgi:hypothetical protein
LLAQRLERQGVVMHEFAFTSATRRQLFATLLDLIRGRRLRAQPHEALRRELLGLEVSETAAGWRVDHRPGRHDDHVVAAALAAQAVAPQDAPMTEAHFGVSLLGSAQSRANIDEHWRRREQDVALGRLSHSPHFGREAYDVDPVQEAKDKAKHRRENPELYKYPLY